MFILENIFIKMSSEFPAARSRRPPGLLHNSLSWTQPASETRLYSGGSSPDAKIELEGEIFFFHQKRETHFEQLPQGAAAAAQLAAAQQAAAAAAAPPPASR